jgi:carbamoyltransferase
MLLVYPIKEAWRSSLPAITHFDGTGRLQAVSKEQNPLFYRLIEEFKALSGFSVILNTSFNTNNEPIVCTPSEAWNCAKRAGLDYLVIGNFLIELDEKQT